MEHLLPTPTATYPGGELDEYHARLVEADGRAPTFVLLNMAVNLLPTPTVQQGRNATSGRQPDAEFNTGTTLNDVAYTDRWAEYAPAIARHEHVIGRPAPDPTDDKRRLSPRFVEWMMALPDGWVTDIDGISRTQQLKMLGNGVVPMQAVTAYAGLIARLMPRSKPKPRSKPRGKLLARALDLTA